MPASTHRGYLLPFWYTLLPTLCLLALGLSSFLSAAVGADSPVLVVLYPEVPQPYRTVFADLISGIEQRSRMARVQSYALAEDVDPRTLKPRLESQGANVVITLGRAATHAYEASGLAVPQVIGALDLSPQTRPAASGISLSVDPVLLFSTLKRLAPQIKRVVVVYNPDRDRWIIDRAGQVTSAHQLTLLPLKASGLRESAQHFLEILNTANPDTDSIWLPMDSQIVDPEVILPVIIEQSWQRRLVVFSSNLMHVNLGVLFALYPDNQALGRQLAEMALQVAQDPSAKPGIEPLRAVKRALNLRVAAHLGLAVDRETERQFELIFQPR